MIILFKKLKSYLIRWLFYIINKYEGQLLKELRFTIGEQYENYEFELKSNGNKTDNGITYEIYLYENDDFKKLFNIPISRGILLLFNADVLSAVYYRFNGNQFEYLLGRINNYLRSDNKIFIDPFTNQKRGTCKISDNTILELLVKKDGNTGICLMGKDFKLNSRKTQNKSLGQT